MSSVHIFKLQFGLSVLTALWLFLVRKYGSLDHTVRVPVGAIKLYLSSYFALLLRPDHFTELLLVPKEVKWSLFGSELIVFH